MKESIIFIRVYYKNFIYTYLSIFYTYMTKALELIALKSNNLSKICQNNASIFVHKVSY